MLRYVIPTFTACMLAGTLGVFAQEQTPAPSQEQAKAPEAATLTGCVQEAKTTDGGTAYLLNKAEGGTATMYVLVGPADRIGQPCQSQGRGNRSGSPAERTSGNRRRSAEKPERSEATLRANRIGEDDR